MKFLVVGAGLSGATFARELVEAGHFIDIIDSRSHIAGNAYDEEYHGFQIHRYGPHFFHTNNKKVVDYLTQFTEWVPFQLRVKAKVDSKLVTFPVNADTINELHLTPEDIINIFYRPYSKKMWGMNLEDLSPQIIARVPSRSDTEDRYFPNDKYQYLPKNGYTSMVHNMLDHPNIDIGLNEKFTNLMLNRYDHIFSCATIDEFYGYKFGALEYRSIRFHTKLLDQHNYQGYPIVNLTDNSPYTRILEWKHIHKVNSDKTLVTFEEPCSYLDNNLERYYPINDVKGLNKQKYLKYKNIPNNKVTFIGRTGLYQYINMDQAINIAIQSVTKFLKNLND